MPEGKRWYEQLICHRTLATENPQPCATKACKLWHEEEEECMEVFIMKAKIREIWRRENSD